MPLVCKYRWRGMAKSNYRKHGGRGKKYGRQDAVVEHSAGAEWVRGDAYG